MNKKIENLIAKYQELADHTRPECGSCPRIKPYGCCSEEHCRVTQSYALEEWGVEVPDTGHPTLPLMGADGCTAAPHLRPHCTVHTCAIYAYGTKPGDSNWTEKYYALREEISEMENLRIFGNKPDAFIVKDLNL